MTREGNGGRSLSDFISPPVQVVPAEAGHWSPLGVKRRGGEGGSKGPRLILVYGREERKTRPSCPPHDMPPKRVGVTTCRIEVVSVVSTVSSLSREERKDREVGVGEKVMERERGR